MNDANRTFLHYRITGKLGEGGMGVVYKAEDLRLSRPVALKFLPRELARSPEILERFQREARAASALNHPHICTVHDVGEYESEPFIVMEFLEGQTLKQKLQDGPLPLGELLETAIQVTDALKAAHGRGIIHRDIKPANIFVNAAGQAKVLDFGLAKIAATAGNEPGTLDLSRMDTHLTVSGTVAGTVSYMSPEQARGEELDSRTDLFSFGVVLYQMAGGRLPFEGTNPLLVFDAILHKEPPPVSQLNFGLPPGIDPIIGRCLAKPRESRYPTAGHLLQALVSLKRDQEFALEVHRRLNPLPVAATPDRPSQSHAGGVTEAQSPESIDSVPSVLIRQQTPLAGRAEELLLLQGFLERVAAGQGTVLLVSGEAGLGKTRLAREVVSEARNRNLLPLSGYCYETEGTPPYVPFVEILEALVRLFPPEALSEVLEDAAPEVARLVPQLRHLLPDIPPPLQLPPEQERHYLFNSLRDCLGRAARIRPLVLVLEDLHWADNSTLLLLQHLAHRVSEMPILVVATYRNAELRPQSRLSETVEELIRRRLAQPLSLKSLPENGVEQMLEALAGHQLPAPLVQAIHEVTEGNPFFVEEIFRFLSEEGKLADGTGEWPAEMRLENLELPDSVRLVIGRRLERLSDRARRVLAAGALIGRDFSFDLLQALELLAPDDLLEAVEEAERSRLIYSFSRGQEIQISFAHALIRQGLLADLSLPRRRQLHGRIARAMEQVWGDVPDKRAADLAHHLVQAGASADAEKTRFYLLRAGDQALAAAAFEDALRYYSAPVRPKDPAERAELSYKRGLALRGLGRWKESHAAWQESLGLFEQVGNAEAVARICWNLAPQLIWTGMLTEARALTQHGLSKLGGKISADHSRLQAWAANAVSQMGEYDEGDRLLSESLQQARDLGDVSLIGNIYTHKAASMLYYMKSRDQVEFGREAVELLSNSPWDRVEALALTQWGLFQQARLGEVAKVAGEIEALANRLGHLGGLWFASRIQGFCNLVTTADLDAFEAFAQRDREVCRNTHTRWVSEGSNWVGLVDFWRGRWDEALRSFEEAVALEPRDFTLGLERASLFRARAYTGDFEGARQLLQAGHLRLPEAGRPNTVGAWEMLFGMVEGFCVMGQNEEAGRLYPLVVEALDTGTVIHFGDCRLLQTAAGIAAAAVGHWDKAEAHFERSLWESETLGHCIEQAEGRRWYATMLLTRARPEDQSRASRLLREAVHFYESAGMPRHLQLIEDLRSDH